MKSIRFLAIALLTAAMLAACAPQETQAPPVVSVPPLRYDSTEEFINGVNNAKEGREETWQETYHNIGEIDWYYDFTDPVKDVKLYSVDANSLSVDLYYRDKEAKESDGLLLEYLRYSDDWSLNDPANEEKFLENWRWPDTIDIMINGHKALKEEVWGDKKTGSKEHIFNQYYWVENGTVIFLRIPAWLLERYPEEIFFNIEKVEIKKPGEIK